MVQTVLFLRCKVDTRSLKSEKDSDSFLNNMIFSLHTINQSNQYQKNPKFQNFQNQTFIQNSKIKFFKIQIFQIPNIRNSKNI